MDSILRRPSWLYSQALQQRKTAYEQHQQSLLLFDRHKWLTQLRAGNEHGLGEIAVGPGRSMLKRLDAAFQAFLPRLQAGQAPGFARVAAGGPLKSVRLAKRGRNWEASLVCLAERKGLPETDRCVGIDLGVRKRPGRSETCPSAACGLVADRDVNPAINILAAGVLAAGAST